MQHFLQNSCAYSCGLADQNSEKFMRNSAALDHQIRAARPLREACPALAACHAGGFATRAPCALRAAPGSNATGAPCGDRDSRPPSAARADSEYDVPEFKA